MFIRAKKRGNRTYLQIVENERHGAKVVQHVKMTLGRLDLLEESGQLDSLLRSGLRFSNKLQILDAHAKGATTTTSTRKIGPALLFERLWKECGIATVIKSLLTKRGFHFPLERVVFTVVLHRLFAPGSDRAAEKWMEDHAIADIDTSIYLQHFYRTMGWIGEVLPQDQQLHATPFMWRANKDLIEEGLFALRRDLFTSLDIVFFDTTSLHFEGKGGTHPGHRGYSKNKRSDLNQIVIGVVLDNNGNPICSEIMPGNTTDVKTLIPIAERLKNQFGVGRICVVADRGMISKKTIDELEQLGWDYILGVRMHKVVEIRDMVLTDQSDYDEIYPPRVFSHDPAPLEVKEVRIDKKDVALKYKQLLQVEDIFRTMKSILDTRPVFHKSDDNISGHVFCSFLALVLRKALQDRIEAKGWNLEWADIIRDVDKIQEVTVEHQGRSFIIRTEATGVAGKAFQAVGVALPPVLRTAEKCGTTPVPPL